MAAQRPVSMPVSRRRRSTERTLRAPAPRVIPPRGDAAVPPRDDAPASGPGYRPTMPEPTPRPTEPDDQISVLIADDQVLVRAGFRAILEAQPGIAVCGEAPPGRPAIDLVPLRRPDVVLIAIPL